MKRTAFLTLVFLTALFIGSAEAFAFECSDPVQTDSGLIRGLEEAGSSACVWKGIPFAAAPVGDLRWAAPHPAPAWSGVRDADHWGDRCMQSGLMAIERTVSKEGMSEDCLYLNVWRPKKSGVFPVMVWVHGGGYYGGAGTTPWYWGDRLAEKGDLVVVTTNYRLNVFGFLAHPALAEEDPNDSTGGYATLDQVEALRWVHENIANFGGDPSNVTIFGESAGGWSICTLLATPLARDLFHRAILESGGCEQSRDLTEGYETAYKVAEAVGCQPNDVECMREVPAKKLLKKSVGGMGDFSYMPHHDGYVLKATPLQMIREGDYNKVPFMAGSNRDEFGKAMKLIPKYYYARPNKYEDKLIEEFGLSKKLARELVELYPLSEFDNRPVEAYGRMFGVDAALACPTYLGLLAASDQDNKTFYYRFEYDDFLYGKYMGAAHAMEIPFVFGNLDRAPADMLYKGDNLEKASALSEIMMGYWINFARTGDPNGEGLPQWPEFESDDQRIMILDNEVYPISSDMAERCEFWDENKGDVEDLRKALR